MPTFTLELLPTRQTWPRGGDILFWMRERQTARQIAAVMWIGNILSHSLAISIPGLVDKSTDAVAGFQLPHATLQSSP